ncbi:helix-turn-helix transcriptional regulator [Paraoerskovia marina]|uniref:helix-turn-helix transcriptional regulator n=1 Tax=Paraoerskovia marina TaxID=545619 RepID=UPI0006936FF7|nr:WYL domain-containing protein [Paraoerskovia marina]
MAERADERLVRLLGLVTYLQSAGPARVEDLARRFDVTGAQILKDVDQLWVAGTPGYWPQDLIDFDAASMERGVVRLIDGRGITRPLRLGTREAVALVAALRALRETVADEDGREAVLDSVLAKLSTATGEAAAALDVRLSPPGRPDVVHAIRTALSSGRRLHLTYADAADNLSERDVDPIELHTRDASTYLLAWCYRAQARRTFRTDRIVSAHVTDTPAVEHDVPRDVTFRPDDDAPVVTVRLASSARWIAEQVPVDAVRDLPDATFEVDLRVANRVWLLHLLTEQARYVVDAHPPDLLTDVARDAQAALDAYAAFDPAPPTLG